MGALTGADNNGNCAEIGGAGPAVVVRDTKDRAGAALTFAPDAWAAVRGHDHGRGQGLK